MPLDLADGFSVVCAGYVTCDVGIVIFLLAAYIRRRFISAVEKLCAVVIGRREPILKIVNSAAHARLIDSLTARIYPFAVVRNIWIVYENAVVRYGLLVISVVVGASVIRVAARA